MRHFTVTAAALAAAMAATPALAAGAGQRTEAYQPGVQTQAQAPGQVQGQQQAGQGTQLFVGPESVRMIQQSLKDKGHYDADVDGIWGPQSEAALRDFQQQQGMPATGNLTLGAIDALGFDLQQLAQAEQEGQPQQATIPGAQPGAQPGEQPGAQQERFQREQPGMEQQQGQPGGQPGQR